MSRSTDVIAATGIGVSDLARSSQFYQAALGMTETQTYQLGHMDEIVLANAGRNALVLMHWTDGSQPTYRNLPVKLIFHVADGRETAEKIRHAGGEVTHLPKVYDALGGIAIGLAKDPDGYVIEFIQPAA